MKARTPEFLEPVFPPSDLASIWQYRKDLRLGVCLSIAEQGLDVFKLFDLFAREQLLRGSRLSILRAFLTTRAGHHPACLQDVSFWVQA